MILGEWMEKEIREQPQRLSANAQRLWAEAHRAVRNKDFQMVLLAARGSSDNAAIYARYLIEIHLGLPVCLAAPSVLTKFKSEVRYQKCLAIGISQSGAAPDVSEVIAAMRRQGHATLAITNTPGSRLTKEAEHSILLDVGPENSIAATKTYTATLLALYQIVRAMGAALPDPTGRTPSEEWINVCHEEAVKASGPLVRFSPVFSLARGYSFCTSHETALKLMECALIPAKAYSTADFAHGPRALAGPGTAALIFDDVPTGLAETGTKILKAPDPRMQVLDPLWDVIFGQWVALLTARARGLDPDQAQNLTKVTETL